MTINLANINLSHWQNFTQEIKQNIENLQHNLQNTTTETIDKSKVFLENKWHISETIANDILSTMITSMTHTFNNLLSNHPHIGQIVHIVTWGINHPVRGMIILLLVIAIIFSIIKAIMRVIETASWSILKVPFILLKGSILGSFKLWKKTRAVQQTKEQRLLEINRRLGELHTEQQQLLAEASQLISGLHTSDNRII
ncbi:hypothetical protein H6F32_01295 [Anabaena sp. FACHB-1237]|uniref:hypothetical protein n=1 Tax=Anabaena sp. FACHB-1237 TaxID=2692769 RepID=UPI001681B51E|nr:hypothetical protein [Anabaena sp. FACHB-1237]MBD2136244.1 hypothetical protein [Anabaena sp. FACHB-1237]